MAPRATTTTPVNIVVSTLVTTISSVITATATATPTTVYGSDPYLEYQPSFAYSLPVQFVLTGVIISMCSILLIHLVFTAPYHWPLAKLNYSLQLTGVSTLLLSLTITLSVILASVHTTSRQWPYMLDYVAVDVPLANWTIVDNGLWYTLDAVTSGLAHATHIQFLTYLYPSTIERRLIITLLGPTALCSSLATFLELSSSSGTRAMADTVKNICNSTLSILFSVAFGVWGFLINRKEAWRTDGGTAIFGAGAISLSLFTMGLNLYQIAKVPPVWIPPLLWAVVLWQSFLGWWWYVGSDAPEPPPTRGPRKRNKGKRKRTKKQTEEEETTDSRLSRVRTRLGLGNASRKRMNRRDPEVEETDTQAILNEREDPTRITPPATPATKARAQSALWGHFLPDRLSTFLTRLSAAHRNAVEQQAVENEMKRFEVYGGAGVRGVPGNGWGLGSFAVRNSGSGSGSGRELEEEGIARSRRLEDGEEGEEDGRRHVSIPMRDLARQEEETLESTSVDMGARRVVWDDEDEYTDVAEDVGKQTKTTTGGRRPRGSERERVPIERLSTPGSSWSWFGPIRRWRLRDVSVF